MLTLWENNIVNAFVTRYAVSKAATERPLRLYAHKVFPAFNTASVDEKESFLEAAESLEKRGIVVLTWAKRHKGEILTALDCIDKAGLFTLIGRVPPHLSAERARKAALSYSTAFQTMSPLFTTLAKIISTQDAERGIDEPAIHDFAKLITHILAPDETQRTQTHFRNLTPRALSVLLYNDSKRLETIINLFNKLIGRIKHEGIAVPDLSFLDRTFPEALIAGKLKFTFIENDTYPPLVNAAGSILGLPIETVRELSGISLIQDAGDRFCNTHQSKVLTVENKETFYALSCSSKYDCVLYSGGYPNKAVSLIICLLRQSGFEFYHAGDLDPDGILILQEIAAVAQKLVTPIRMDASTFNQYREHGRILKPSILRQIRLIHETTRNIAGMQELITLIETNAIGIEQEIIDYCDA
ncbi:MAG: hypothetical protein Ta2G_10750 [Termitinemataceae bacterium]|nr:MAG: hypothetical protein Ta2G_10750 [Termitinemataceae bacterium]